MPLIIDANRACDFTSPLSKHAISVVQGIKLRKVKIVVGGHLLRELVQTPMLSLLTEWRRVGALLTFSNDDVDSVTKAVYSLSIKSDDGHIIALALVSQARLLYTDDKALIEDFKNGALLKPKGSVIRPVTPLKSAAKLLASKAV